MPNQTTWTPLCVEGAYMGTDARFEDHRGYFQELFHRDKYPEHVRPTGGIPQVSLSHSHRGVLRGIHCSAYAKLITIPKGAIYDVIVDLRADSPTYRRWCAVVVSSENRRQLHIPAGCGHGFLCLEDADMLYLQSGTFDPPNEIDLDPFDPSLGVHWPKLDDVPDYVMSDKDRNAPKLVDLEKFKGTVAVGDEKPLRRVLVIGASGQVGGALVEAYGAKNVVGTYSKVPCDGMVHFDLEAAAKDAQLAEDLMTMCKPEIVCICAGRTWVDGCENEGDLPQLVNCDGPRAVAKAAKACGARTVYYSTDYVFDGARFGQIYKEDDDVGPVNVYGEGGGAVRTEANVKGKGRREGRGRRILPHHSYKRLSRPCRTCAGVKTLYLIVLTSYAMRDEGSRCEARTLDAGSSKLAGEVAVMEEDPNSLVLRTTGVFGPEKQGKNFVYQLCNALGEKRDMMCAIDSFGSPTYNRDLASMTVGLLEADATGVYHCVGPETMHRHAFATLVADTLGLDASHIKSVDSETLYGNTVTKLGFAATRGKHLGMVIDKVKAALPEKYHPKSIREALLHWKANPRGAECKF